MANSFGIHTKAENVNGATVTTGAQTTQATGSTLVVFGVGNHAVTVTDSKSNTWTVPAGGNQGFNTPNGQSVCAYCQNATGGTGHTFTVTQSGGSGPSIEVVEIIGAVTSGGPDAFAAANPAGGTATVSGPGITTVADGAAVLTFMAGASNVNSVATASTGTILDTISGANFVTGADSSQIKTTHGAANDTFTFSAQTFFDMVTYNISFAPAATGGTMPAATGAFTLTGEPVTFSSSQTLAAAFGSFALTGETATLSQGGGAAITLFASAGAFDLIGAPTTQDLQTDVTAGLFTLIGVPANLPGSQTTTGGPSLFRRRHHKFVQGH